MKIEKVGVLGAGTMGSGIAQTVAVSGRDVVICDVAQDRLDAARQSIKASLDRLVAKKKLDEKQKDDAISRIGDSTSMDDFATVDIVIEAVTEDIDVKAPTFSRLNSICRSEAILASNTSSLSLTELARASGRAENVIGMHFFNPVPIMGLVEIIRALQTSDQTFKQVEDLTKALGKTPVAVQDSPGFVVNRMLVPMINEAVFILYEGLARAEEIDAAMKLGASHPIGPLALADMIGIDVCLSVMEILHREFGDSKYRPCPLLKKMVAAGQLGRKTGHGFFAYSR